MQTRQILSTVVVLLSSVVAAVDYHDWIAADGYANEPENWNGGVLPASSEAPRFTGNGSYTIRFPSSGYTLPGKFTTVRELADGSTVTFDATEGDWLQQSDSYESNWQAFMVCANASGTWPHILNVTDATGGKPLFRLSGGKVRFTRNASFGSVLELLDGTWNFYDPTGTANTTHGLALLNAIAADAGSKVILQPGSSLRAANLYVDCGTPNSRVVITGGEHKIWNAVQIGRNNPANIGSGYLPTLQVSGGSVELMSGRFSVANRSGCAAQMLMDGIGRVMISNESLSLATVSASTGTVSLADSSEIHVANNLMMSAQAQCKSSLSLSGSSALTIENEIQVGNAANTEAEIALSGSSRLVQNRIDDVIRLSRAARAKSRFDMGGDSSAMFAGWLTIGGMSDAESTLVISNNASLTVMHQTGISIGRYSRSKGLLRIQDNAKLYLPNAKASGSGGICLSGSNNQWGDNMSGASRLVMEGGLIDTPDGQLILCGTNSFVTLAGGETRFCRWHIRGDANTVSSEGWVVPTNTILVTGGDHTVGSSGASELYVGESGTMACLDVRGGTVTAFGQMSVGIGATGNGCAVFALSGTGRVVMNRKSNVSEIAFAAGNVSARARAELTGGELVISCVKGGKGSSELFADGVKMTLNGTDATAAIHDFTTAELGAGGLTLDTDGFDSSVAQAFADASGAAGLFTKTGVGTLTATVVSSHARTRVSGGTLVTANAFGRSLEVAAGATLDLTGATSLAVEDMVLGTAAASRSATIVGDWSAPITVTGTLSIVGKTGILLADAVTVGSVELFRVSGTMDAAELANLEVENVSSSRGYAFTTTDDNGTTVVSLAISAVEVTDNTWTGAEGSNWTEDNFTSVPSALNRYVFPVDVATKDVTIPAGGALARGLSVAGDYLFQGGVIALMGGISVTSGSATFGNSLDLKGNQAFNVAAGTTLTLNGPLASQSIGVMRTGNGAFVLGAANTDFFGSWSLAGGYHRFAYGAAFGAESATPVTLISGTLQYAGATPGTLMRPVVVTGASDQSRVVIDAGVGLTLSNGFNSTHGGIVKIGSGTLEIVCPAGAVALGTGNANSGDSAVSSIPSDGTSPSGSSGSASAGMDILDGTLRVIGAGKDKATVNQTQKTWIGTGYSGQSAPVALEIENVTYNQGGANRALVVGGGVASGKNNVPTLRVNNAVVNGNTLQLGNGSAVSYPTVVVTNSTVEMIYEVTIGQGNDNIHPVVRIGAGGIVRQNRPSGSATGIVLNRNVDVEVSGGVLESRKGDNGSNCGVKFNADAFGRMRFTNGGRLRTYMFTVGNTPSSEKNMSLEFDDGVLEMTLSGDTSLGTSEYQVFTVGENGMEVAIGSGISHGFATPFTGTGTVAKTGAGSMKLLPCAVSGRDVIEAAGGLEVREGGVNLGGETIAVSGIWGGGTVTNGTLTGIIIARPDAEGVLTLGENLTAGSGVTVDVRADDPADLARGQVVPVAAVDGATVNVSTWKCRVANEGLRGECSLVDGVAYVTLKPRSGMTLIIR